MGLEGITMNREIKFRIWNNTIKYFVKNLNGEIATFTLLTLSDYLQRNSITNIDDFTFLRYTGLQDKNGKEIYEGDIVKALSSDNGYLSTVEWYQPDARYGFKSIRCNNMQFLYNLSAGCSKWEVVGNILENPELCESKVDKLPPNH